MATNGTVFLRGPDATPRVAAGGRRPLVDIKDITEIVPMPGTSGKRFTVYVRGPVRGIHVRAKIVKPPAVTSRDEREILDSRRVITLLTQSLGVDGLRSGVQFHVVDALSRNTYFEMTPADVLQELRDRTKPVEARDKVTDFPLVYESQKGRTQFVGGFYDLQNLLQSGLRWDWVAEHQSARAGHKAPRRSRLSQALNDLVPGGLFDDESEREQLGEQYRVDPRTHRLLGSGFDPQAARLGQQLVYGDEWELGTPAAEAEASPNELDFDDFKYDEDGGVADFE